MRLLEKYNEILQNVRYIHQEHNLLIYIETFVFSDMAQEYKRFPTQWIGWKWKNLEKLFYIEVTSFEDFI